MWVTKTPTRSAAG